MGKSVVIESLYVYDNGQARIEFVQGDEGDWYVWSPKRMQRLATYRTKRELLDAYERSDNSHGPYGLSCPVL